MIRISVIMTKKILTHRHRTFYLDSLRPAWRMDLGQKRSWKVSGSIPPKIRFFWAMESRCAETRCGSLSPLGWQGSLSFRRPFVCNTIAAASIQKEPLNGQFISHLTSSSNSMWMTPPCECLHRRSCIWLRQSKTPSRIPWSAPMGESGTSCESEIWSRMTR